MTYPTRKRGSLTYRAVPASNLPEDPEHGAVWFFEYQVLPERSWRPRGTFYEKNGVFIWGDQEFPTADSALAARVASGV